MSDTPESFPLSPFFMASVQLHAAFEDIMAAGFSREEAMAVFLVILKNQMGDA